MRRTALALLFAGIAALVFTGSCFALAPDDRPLTNERLIEMSKSGAAEDAQIKAVEAGGDALDTSVQGLLALKGAGVGQKAIAAAIAAKTKKAAAEAAAANALIPDEAGVYAVIADKLTAIEPEVLNTRTGRTAKAMFRLYGGHINATVQNPHSPLQLKGSVVFVIRCLGGGDSVSDYQLLPLDVRGDRREFRTLSKDAWGRTSTGTKRVIAFKFENVAPRTYKIALSDLKPGEYAFLPPGAVTSANVAAMGQLYSFGIKE